MALNSFDIPSEGYAFYGYLRIGASCFVYEYCTLQKLLAIVGAPYNTSTAHDYVR